MAANSERANGAGGGRFPVTRWGVILAAGGLGSTVEAEEAWEVLCHRYWLPVYVAIRASGRGPEDAEDLTQEFFAMLLDRGSLETTAPEKGRFRSFLAAALRNFLINDWRKSQRQKRGGGQAPLSIDRDLGEARYETIPSAKRTNPDRVFERQWAREILDRTLKNLADCARREGKARQFEVLSPFLDGTEGERYADLGKELEISEGAARMAMFRLRGRFRRMLREEIAETVSDEDAVDEEIRHLFAVFAG